MRGGRFLLFLIAIVVGAAGGLAYGWLSHPRNGNTTPERLRSDYKADYVLMVAEVYRTEGDESLAAHRLALLSSQAPVRTVQEAILAAGGLGYPTTDLDLMARLARGLSQTRGAPSEQPSEQPSGSATPGGTP